jgi:hypothetical protein
MTDAHPGVTFRPTPLGGRIAGLVRGPDVVEVIRVIDDLDATGEGAVAEAAEWLGLELPEVRVALRYYAAFPDEVGTELRRRRNAADEVHRQWRRQRRAG